MNIYPIQQSIVNRLQSDFTAASVDFLAKDLPESESDYDLGVKTPIAYVVYAGSQAMPSATANTVVQSRKLHFNVECHARKLYSNNGLYVLRDILEQSLVGFKPTNSQKLYLLKDDISQADGIWVHVFQFECETMLVQKAENEPIVIPSFTELVNND